MVVAVNGDVVWWPNVKQMNRIIESHWKVKGFTYQNHGTRGAASAVDYLVSNGWGTWVNEPQRKLGWAIANWAVDNSRELGVDYVIFEVQWNHLDGRGWVEYPEESWSGGSVNVVSRRHGDHVHITCVQKADVAGVREPGIDEIAWENIILAHAGFEDGKLCGEAYKVLMGARTQASIANADNIERAIDYFQSFDVTNGKAHFVVVGQGAKDKFPAGLVRYIGAPKDESDYRDAVGEDLARTRHKLARALDGIGEGLGDRLLAQTTQG